MSVEKLHEIMSGSSEIIEFSQVSNKVITGIKDNDALRVWLFLYSKSGNWELSKAWVLKQCNVSDAKGRKIWPYMIRSKLMQYKRVVDSKGRIIKHDYRILSGSIFDDSVPFINPEKPTRLKTHIVDKTDKTHMADFSHCGKPTPMENDVLLNKDLTKQRYKQKKDKSFYTKNKKNTKAIEQKAENEKKHSWAAMKNESAEIERNERYKKMVIPPEFKALTKQIMAKAKINAHALI